MAWLAAELAYRFAPGPRRAVTANLRRVLEAGDVAGAVRSVFRTQAYNYVDLFLMPRLDPEWLASRTDTVNLGSFLEAHAQRKGVIVATAHLGNFDLLVQMTRAHGIPVTVLVEHLTPEQLFQTVIRLRGAHGVRLTDSPREVLQTLRSEGVVAMAADRVLQGRGARVTFFGEPALMPAGAVELALRTGAVIVPAFGLRLPGRCYRITIEPALALPGPPDPSARHAGIRELLNVLERHIRAHPEQWVVFQPIWDQTMAGEDIPREPARALAR